MTARLASFRVRTLLFGVYGLALLLANLQSVKALFAYSRSNESASHVILIPFVTFVLIWLERKSIFSSLAFDWKAARAPAIGGAALLGAAFVYAPSLGADDALSVAVGALVVLSIAGFVLFYGAVASRAALFPLLFLALSVPIPVVLLDPVVQVLKIWSTEAVAVLFSLTGTPYYRDGFLFTLSTVTIEVADECSGIRSTLALALTSLLIGHMSLTRRWSKAVLVTAVFPITVFKNAVRIVTLTLLAIHVDAGFLTGRLHREGGIVFFVMALGLLLPCITLLRRVEARGAGVIDPGHPSHVQARPDAEQA